MRYLPSCLGKVESGKRVGMKLIWKITKAELQTLFFSPLAWLMLVVLLGIWVFNVFYDKFDLLVRTQELGDSIEAITVGCILISMGFMRLFWTRYIVFSFVDDGID